MKKQNILLIDQNDSFTYNLAHLLNETGYCNLLISNYYELNITNISHFDKIIFGPGPGRPDEYSHFKEIIKTYGQHKSILGICLGHQAIGLFFGSKLIHLDFVMHGQQVKIYHTNNDSVFNSIPNPFKAGLYHSWALDANTFPPDILPLAQTKDNILMGFKHKKFKIYGFQFHPESYMTPDGITLISNWIIHG